MVNEKATQQITVVDAMMGSGKSTWSFQYINDNPDASFVYATPFLKEVDRIMGQEKDENGEFKPHPVNRQFFTPQAWGKTKRDDFNALLQDGRDIATTHATFSRANAETMRLLKESHYTLILDEVVEPLVDINSIRQEKQPRFTKNDIQFLADRKVIEVAPDFKVNWNADEYNDFKYSMIEHCAKNHTLYYLKNNMLAWQLPPELFTVFDRVFILTYQFEGSGLYPYFQMHGIKYDKATISRDSAGRYSLSEWHPDVELRTKFKGLIDIYDDHRELECNLYIAPRGTCGRSPNDYRGSALSKSWYIGVLKNHRYAQFETIRKNVKNYFHNVTKAKAKQIMWTTYKGAKDGDDSSGNGRFYAEIKGEGYVYTRRLTKEEKLLKGDELKHAKDRISCFVACNARATNDFRDRDTLAYLINYNQNPDIVDFYAKQKTPEGQAIDMPLDLWSLANMLQWIFRSAIRDDKPIRIYIPSTRMRHLLQGWLDGTI